MIDNRATVKDPLGYVIMRDTFMSGWGLCPGTSYYAIAVESWEEADTVRDNAKCRSEMVNVKFVESLPKTVKEDDHLKVVDRHNASRFFEPGAFAE